MDQKNEEKVLNALYDRLFDAITYAPAGQASAFDKSSVFIQFAKNQALNPDDFKNAASPVNPNGDLNTAELFARMVDAVPAINSNYSPTSNKVSKTYGKIVENANTKVQTDSAQQEIYDKAFNFLTKKAVPAKNLSPRPTPIYSTYEENKTAYITAVVAYATAYLDYNLESIDDQRKWQATEPLLKNGVNKAYNRWRAQGATQVEGALATLESSINNIVKSAIKDAQSNFKQLEKSSSMGISDPWYMTYATPTNWYDISAIPNFTQLVLKSKNITEKSDSKYSKYSAGGTVKVGLWSVGAGASRENKESNEHMDANEFELSAKIAVVQINRPWINGLIFRMKGWYLNGQAKGGISNGTLENNSSGTLPLIPTAFIVAREIEITANWSTRDKSHVENNISGKASVGWGPFAVNGSYSHGNSADYFNSTFDGNTLKIPGMQIIGWVNEIVPFSSPLGDD